MQHNTLFGIMCMMMCGMGGSSPEMVGAQPALAISGPDPLGSGPFIFKMEYKSRGGRKK